MRLDDLNENLSMEYIVSMLISFIILYANF
jgi:hypothetical protein